MWKHDTACFLSDHHKAHALIISVTQLAEKITAVVMAADLFVTSLWERRGMRRRASGSHRLTLVLQKHNQQHRGPNVKMMRDYIWALGC